jgi:hypothetical protein
MYLISWEEGAISIGGALSRTSCNKGYPWDLERNEILLKK